MGIKPYIIEVLVGLSRSRSKRPPKTAQEIFDIQEEVLEKIRTRHPWLADKTVVTRCLFGRVLCTPGRVRVRLLVETTRPLDEVVKPDGEGLVIYQPIGEIFAAELDVFWVTKQIAKCAEGQFAYDQLNGRDEEETGDNFRFFFMPDVLTAVEKRVEKLVSVEDVAIAFADEIDSAAMEFFKDQDLLTVGYDDLDNAAAYVAEKLGQLRFMEGR